jgi:hypothetical protein
MAKVRVGGLSGGVRQQGRPQVLHWLESPEESVSLLFVAVS